MWELGCQTGSEAFFSRNKITIPATGNKKATQTMWALVAWVTGSRIRYMVSATSVGCHAVDDTPCETKLSNLTGLSWWVFVDKPWSDCWIAFGKVGGFCFFAFFPGPRLGLSSKFFFRPIFCSTFLRQNHSLGKENTTNAAGQQPHVCYER